MNKKNIHKILYLLSIILVIMFLIFTIHDYINYDSVVSSAPFSAYVLSWCTIFLLPSVIIFLLANLIRKKFNK